MNTDAEYTWNDGSENWQERDAGFYPTPNSSLNGKLNHYIINRWNEIGNGTYLIVTIQDAPYGAVAACESLNDTSVYSPSGYLEHNDWFLPSVEELEWMYNHKSDFDSTAPFANASYWSSTGQDSDDAWYKNFSSGYQWHIEKDNTRRVRCARHGTALSSPPSITLSTRPQADCSSGHPAEIGTLCTNDGTIYAGTYLGNHYYITPEDEVGQYSWNNSSENWIATGATNTSDGEANTTTLTTSPVNSDIGAPYHAVQACKARNDINYLGYNDWFLPSKGELNMLYANRTSIGSFSSSSYWTSTEHDSDDAYYKGFSSGYEWYRDKDDLLNVRCIRIP